MSIASALHPRQVVVLIRLNRTTLLALVLLLAQTSRRVFVQAQPQQHTSAGQGICVDSANKFYHEIGLSAGFGGTSADCETLCIACKDEVGSTSVYRGFSTITYTTTLVRCYCVFDSDANNFNNFNGKCSTNLISGGYNTSPTNTGTGPASGNGSTVGNTECFQFAGGVSVSAPTTPSSNPSLRPSESESPSDDPSTLPSEMPSAMSSESPSDDPSSSPSEQPSLSTAPSESPSDQPSETPSATTTPSSNPSLRPSESPSDVPSTLPSEMPSAMPSESPSDVPSTLPSEMPSAMPSESPSDDPSSSPSEQPSLSTAPSESPSDQPSETPSAESSASQSSEPSSTPSCSPSNSPTESPSVKDGVNLFYPDWANGGETCRNDGDHPDYMEINPTQWLSSSLDACCKKFFGGFFYKQCIGAYPPDADDCNVMLFYPDWNGSNEGCVDEGQEPLYMLGNAQYFFSNTREECCEKFYKWNYYSCTGTTPDGSGDYYPAWNGSPATCKNDGKMPDYMLNPDNARWYLFSTLKECCEMHFNYELTKCLGSSGTSVAGSNEWYVEYSANTCVQDCIGSSTTCGGLVEGAWVETFSSKKACCNAKLWYYPDCIRTNK